MSLVLAWLLAAAIWAPPPPATTFQIQLDGTVDTSVPARIYEVDGFDNSSALVAKLHGLDRVAVCYVSAGSWENWRPDAKQFPASVLGKPLDGWPGERWLDVRRLDVLGPIMRARFAMCAAKGFDAVDPDNVDGYTNDTGFPLTGAVQIAYNRFLARTAHSLGLQVALKNDGNQVPDLVGWFDFAVDEQCFQYAECGKLLPFVRFGEPVFDIEYSLSPAQFCPEAKRLGLTAMRKHLSLDSWRDACP